MSQFQQIQLEGPKVFVQPKNTMTYQESQTIMPNPQVGVGIGLDFGAITEAAKNLGVGLVETSFQREFTRKENAVKALQNRTSRLIDAHSERNDMDGVELTYTEYKEATRDILGFDPEVETDMLGPYGNLSQGINLYNANIDAARDKARRGWADEIEGDSYDSFTANEIAGFEGSTDKVAAMQGRIENLKKLYSGSGGGDISSDLPDTGFTIQKRRLLLKMKHDYVKLLEDQEKMRGGKGMMELVGDSQRNVLRTSKAFFDQSKSLMAQATKLRDKGPLSPVEEQMATQLEAEALRLATSGVQSRMMATSALLDTAVRQHVNENREYFETAFGKLSDDQYVEIAKGRTYRDEQGNRLSFVGAGVTDIPDDPTSMDAFSFLMSNREVNPETGSALAMAWEAEQEASSGYLLDQLQISRQLFERNLKKNTDNISLQASDAEKTLKIIDAKMAEETTAGELLSLRLQKVQVIEELERVYRDEFVIPSLPKNLKDRSPALMSFIKGQRQGKHLQSTWQDALRLREAIAVTQSPSQGFGLSFDADSLAILDAAVGDQLSQVTPLYRKATEELNRLKGLFADSSDGKSKSFEKALKEKQDSIEKYVKYTTGQAQSVGSLSPAEKETLTILGAGSRLSATGFNDPVKIMPLDEAIVILRKNKDNPNFVGNKIPFGMNQFMSTQWYDEMLRKAGSMPSSDEAIKYMTEITDLFLTDVMDASGKQTQKFDDFIPKRGAPDSPPNNAAIVSTIKDMVIDPQKNQTVTASAFLMLPNSTRLHIISSLEEDIRNIPNSGERAAAETQLSWFTDMHNAYNEQQTVRNFLAGWKKSGITAAQSKRADQLTDLLNQYKTEPKDSKRTSEQRQKDPNGYAFVDKWRGGLMKEIARRVTIPGWNGETESANPQSVALFEESFGRQVLLQLLKAGEQPDGSIKMDASVITETIDRVNDSLIRQNWQYSRDRLFRQELGIEKVKTVDQGPEQLTISGKLIEGATGFLPEPDNRVRFILANGNFKASPQATATERKLFLGQVAQSGDIVEADWKEISSDPFKGMITYDVVRNGRISRTTLQQLGKNEGAVLNDLVFAATSNMPNDNLGVLASVAAISLLPTDETDKNKALDFVAKTAKEIRTAIETGKSDVYKIDVVGLKANDGTGSILPTIRLMSGDAILSTFQVNTTSFNQGGFQEATRTMVKANSKFNEDKLLNEFNKRVSETWIKSNGQKSRDDFTDAVVIELLTKDPNRVLITPRGMPWGGSRGGDYNPQYQVETLADGSRRIVLVPYMIMMGKRYIPVDSKPEVIYKFPQEQEANRVPELFKRDQTYQEMVEEDTRSRLSEQKQLRVGEETTQQRVETARQLDWIGEEVDRTVTNLMRLRESPASIAAGKAEKKKALKALKDYETAVKEEPIAVERSTLFRSLPQVPTPTKVPIMSWTQKPVSSFVTEPTINVDYDFIDTHFALNGRGKGISPEVVYHRGQYFLVPNPGAVDKELLRGRLDRTKETFGSFETRREADDFMLQLNKHFDVVFKEWKKQPRK